jgi:bifunctional enzyme CysN/CysC/sulfate adenylyltransferase subunit 1
MLVSPDQLPSVSRKFHARVVWLHDAPLAFGRTYLVKHTVRQTKIRALHIRHRVNVNTLAEEHATRLEMNEIGLVEFESHVPLFFDPYSSNRTTGSFILIDSATNATVGAGMIQEKASAARFAEESKTEVVSDAVAETSVAVGERYARHGHLPAVFLLEGRPALASRVERLLFDAGFEVLHFGHSELSDDALAEIVRVTQAAGIVVIYSGHALAGEIRRRIAAEFGNHFLDLAGAQQPHANEEETVRYVLALAQSLRLAGPRKGQERVN